MAGASKPRRTWMGQLTQAIPGAIVGGLIAGLITLFHEEIYAYASAFVVSGNLYGEYILQASEFEESTNSWKPVLSHVNLLQGGTRVFGTERTVRQSWRWFGYFRDPVLAMAYENNDAGAVGTGTYTLTRDWPYVLWGHWIGVVCNGNTHKRFLAQCPAMLYRIDHAKDATQYSEFMKRDCVSITLDSGPCPVRKTAAASQPSEGPD